MNKANECTCPSGNGSLVHPCPTHPAVEQAGGDERAAFELFVRKHCGMPAHIAVNWDAKFTNDAWEGWKARAALAQPSPDAPYADDIAADLERSDWTPEDALRWYAAGKHFDTVNGRTRIIDTGAVASNALKHLSLPYLEMKGDAELTELREAMAQPSPAQAEAERPEGPTEDELEAAGLGYPLHKEEAVKLWYSGFRSEVITVLEAWEAIGHDIGMNPDKGELLDSLRYMLEKCEAHDAALAEVAGLRSLLNSLLCYVERDIDRMRSDRDKSDNKEIYDRSISLAMERLKAAQNAVFTTEPGCDTAVELAAQTTQAQHCVPELLVRAEDFVSGKEVPQAWLDVQAERRRQITAEGWTPEHDDLYCAAELPRAAAAYILNGANDEAPAIWPFSAKWWKPRDARSNYVRAGALILAEIERLDRAAHGKEVGHE